MLTSLWIYGIKVNIILSCLYLLYCLCCKKEKLLVLNRTTLLAIIIFSFLTPIIPPIPIPLISNDSVEKLPFDYLLNLSKAKPVLIQTELKDVISIRENTDTGSQLVLLSSLIYVAIAIVIASRFITHSYRALYIIQRSRKTKSNGLILCEPKEAYPPFSYFKYIVINKLNFTEQQYEQIIHHEEAHCKQWHTIDLILIEMAHAFLWINPLMNVLKRDLKLNLEYLADDHAIALGGAAKAYQYDLLQMATGIGFIPGTNRFAHLNVKQRITTINKDKPKRAGALKYSLIVPGFLIFFSLTQFLESSGMQADKRTSFLYNTMTGFYQSAKADHVFVHISYENGHLTLEQLWDKERISFEPENQFEFYNQEKRFSLRFIQEANGKIKQLIAFEKDFWNKIEDSKIVLKKEIDLSPEQLKTFEARFQYKDQPVYINIKSKGDAIMVNESWTGNNIRLYPETPSRFFSKQNNYTLEFIRNTKGEIVKAVAFGKDKWHKISNAQPRL